MLDEEDASEPKTERGFDENPAARSGGFQHKIREVQKFKVQGSKFKVAHTTTDFTVLPLEWEQRITVKVIPILEVKQ